MDRRMRGTITVQCCDDGTRVYDAGVIPEAIERGDSGTSIMSARLATRTDVDRIAASLALAFDDDHWRRSATDDAPRASLRRPHEPPSVPSVSNQPVASDHLPLREVFPDVWLAASVNRMTIPLGLTITF